MSLSKFAAEWLTARDGKFAHDRTETVGASEVGKCLRMIGYSKAAIPKDEGATELSGFGERGNVMEDNFSAPMARAWVESLGGKVFYDGQGNQITMIREDIGISATPDGFAVGLPADALAKFGIKKFSGSLLIEQKSYDPRSNTSKFPKPEHIFQVQQGMGMLRLAKVDQMEKDGTLTKTGWAKRLKALKLPADTPKPDAALIIYTNASNYLEIEQFAIKFNEGVFKNGQRRAGTIMAAKASEDVERLPPEGKQTDECRNCDYSGRCLGWAALVPTNEKVLPDKVKSRLAVLAQEHASAKKDEADAEADRKEIEGEIKMIMSQENTKFVDAGVAKFIWRSTPGRSSFDRKKAEATLKSQGYDVAQFITEGKPSDSLKIELA